MIRNILKYKLSIYWFADVMHWGYLPFPLTLMYISSLGSNILLDVTTQLVAYLFRIWLITCGPYLFGASASDVWSDNHGFNQTT